MRRSQMKIALVATIGCAAVLTACGSSGGSSSSTSTATSSGNFAARADAVCLKESANEVVVSRTPITSEKMAASQVNALVTALKSDLAELRQLSPPTAMKSSYQAFLAQWPALATAWLRGERALAKSGLAAYDAGIAPRVRSAIQTEAGKAGLTTCAGKLPAREASAITALARRATLHPTASLCTVNTTARFNAVTGGIKGCLQSTTTYSKSVQVSNVQGTFPQATAIVSRIGGNQQGGVLVWALIKQGAN